MRRSRKLRSWDEVAEIKAKYLKPVRIGPQGDPIYSGKDVALLFAALNLQYLDA